MTAATWPLFLAAAGGGAVARFLLGQWVHERTHRPGSIPWGTFVVNVTGCLLLGVLTGLGLYHGLGRTTLVVVGTGGLGAYTTFSAFAAEAVRAVDDGYPTTAIRYVAATVGVGLAAAAAGIAVTTVW